MLRFCFAWMCFCFSSRFLPFIARLDLFGKQSHLSLLVPAISGSPFAAEWISILFLPAGKTFNRFPLCLWIRFFYSNPLSVQGSFLFGKFGRCFYLILILSAGITGLRFFWVTSTSYHWFPLHLTNFYMKFLCVSHSAGSFDSVPSRPDVGWCGFRPLISSQDLRSPLMLRHTHQYAHRPFGRAWFLAYSTEVDHTFCHSPTHISLRLTHAFFEPYFPVASIRLSLIK